MVAVRRDLTNGVSDIAAAKIKWLYIQAVSRSGLYLSMVVAKGARLGGGRGVKLRVELRLSCSGD